MRRERGPAYALMGQKQETVIQDRLLCRLALRRTDLFSKASFLYRRSPRLPYHLANALLSRTVGFVTDLRMEP